MTDQVTSQQVEDLTPDELEDISAGHSGGVNVVMGDGSVRFVDAADYVVWRKTLGTGG